MSEREQVLDRRVRWLDRKRRTLAVIAGALITVLVAVEVPLLMGDDWPKIHTSAMSLAAGVIGWLVFEVAIAWVTAVWETELDHLLVARGLPRAELRSRRWRRR